MSFARRKGVSLVLVVYVAVSVLSSFYSGYCIVGPF